MRGRKNEEKNVCVCVCVCCSAGLGVVLDQTGVQSLDKGAQG